MYLGLSIRIEYFGIDLFIDEEVEVFVSVLPSTLMREREREGARMMRLDFWRKELMGIYHSVIILTHTLSHTLVLN